MNARRRTPRRETIAGPYVNTTFGSVIRAAWEASGLTQQQLADRLGVKQPRVAEIFELESMTERTFDRCLAALGVDLEVRIVGRGKP